MFIAALLKIAMPWNQPVAINQWMDKENVVCVHKGILFNLNKEENSVICNNTDEPVGYCAKWNKPGTEKSTHNLSHMWNPKKSIS